MTEKIDKRLRADLFRTRLAEAMRLRDTNQSVLARAIGVDRSTVSQLLKGTAARLPNAQVVGECAGVLGVSADWLLGLTDRPETAADMLANTLSLTEAPRALVDEQIFAWHKEAAGYKIRHVPAGLPDMLKTRPMLEWEYAPHLGRSTDQAIGASEDRMNWMRAARSDYEIAVPLYEIESFARGEGYYRDLPAEVRRAQLDHLIAVTGQLYPGAAALPVRRAPALFRADHDLRLAAGGALSGAQLHGVSRHRAGAGDDAAFRRAGARGVGHRARPARSPARLRDSGVRRLGALQAHRDLARQLQQMRHVGLVGILVADRGI